MFPASYRQIPDEEGKACAQLRPLFFHRSEATLGQGDTNCWLGQAKRVSASDKRPFIFSDTVPVHHLWLRVAMQTGKIHSFSRMPLTSCKSFDYAEVHGLQWPSSPHAPRQLPHLTEHVIYFLIRFIVYRAQLSCRRGIFVCFAHCCISGT